MSTPQRIAPALVDRAREMFFVERVDPGPHIAAHIRRSWRRCDALALAPTLAEPILHADFTQRSEAAAWLRQCAQPELDGLAEHALEQGCVVILSDASGLILDEIGSPDFLPKAHRIALTPGVEWSEAQRGTNAIGTALLEREALMVLGGEHFLTLNGALGCAAAPIFNAQGELSGVLDISGESVHVDAHALGLVRMAATQVEHRMMSAARSESQLLRFHRRPGLLGTPREGLLSVQDGVITGVNRTALGLLGLGWADVLGQPAARIFGSRWQNRQGLVAAADGQEWAVRLDRAAPAMPIKKVTPVRAEPERDDALAPLLARAARVSAQGLPLMVNGETGSGKEVFVRRLHRISRRANGPLVAVNCAALPDSLIEAELFGYEDGAFTGARRRGLPGRLREAHGGMLFLDEIGDMPLSLQTRLLRVLEARCVRPLGGTQDVAVDFDLVCATHRDLHALVAEGRFREDLLYRLHGYAVAIPPLRERNDRRALIEQLFSENGGAARDLILAPAALAALDARPWPGNVRELLSVLRSLIALADDGSTLDLADLGLPPDDSKIAANAENQRDEREGMLASLTEDTIRQTLADCLGNVTVAARRLGLHRSTLYRHLARAK